MSNPNCDCAGCSGQRAWNAAGVSGACYNGWHEQCGGLTCSCSCGHTAPSSESVPLSALLYPKASR